MDVIQFAFRKPNDGREEVFIVREDRKCGLISVPKREDVIPSSLSDGALRALGGSFLARPQWDEIRVNVCFAPDDDLADAVHAPNRVTCDYYVLQDGRWGILDETGRMIQEPAYKEALIVNQRLSLDTIEYHVRHGFSYMDTASISGRVLVRKAGRWGMLRGRGDVVLPCAYNSIDVADYYLACFNVYIAAKAGRYGVVDAYGAVRIPIEYPPLRCTMLDHMWDSSVFRIEGDAGIGYVRLGNGQCLVAPEWERIDTDRLYLAPDDEPSGYLFTVWRDGRCGLILDNQGMIIPPVWDEIVPRRVQFQDPLSYSVRRGMRWGCCDESGQLICDAVWDEVGIYLNGIARVKRDGKWGAIGADGRLRVPLEWDEIDGFGVRIADDDALAHTNAGVLLGYARRASAGLPANLSWAKRNGLWDIIDTGGHIVAEPAEKTRKAVLEINGRITSIDDEAGDIEEPEQADTSFEACDSFPDLADYASLSFQDDSENA